MQRKFLDGVETPGSYGPLAGLVDAVVKHKSFTSQICQIENYSLYFIKCDYSSDRDVKNIALLLSVPSFKMTKT